MALLFMNLRRIDASPAKFNNMINYYSRDDAVNKDSIDPEKLEAMMDYYGRFEKEDVSTAFDFKGDKTLQQATKELELYKPKQLYQSVISFKSEDALRMGFESKKDFLKISETFVIEASKALNIKQENLVWSGFLHQNTDNPHCHLYFFDKTKVEQPLLTKEELRRVRSRMGSHLLNQVENYKERDAQRKEVIKEIATQISSKNLDELIRSRMVIGHSHQRLNDHDKSIVLALKESAHLIKLKGRKQEGILKKYYPEAFEKIEEARELMLSDSIHYDAYKKEVQIMKENFETLYGKGSKADAYYQNQMDRIHKTLNNQIINLVVKERDILTHPDFNLDLPPASFLSVMDHISQKSKVDFQKSIRALAQMNHQSHQDKLKQRKEKEVDEYEELDQEI